jgi:Holliday junction resolvase YEN1
MFRSSDICDAWAKEGSCLKTDEDCRNAMVLIALLSGGDYVPEGIGGLGELQSSKAN